MIYFEVLCCHDTRVGVMVLMSWLCCPCSSVIPRVAVAELPALREYLLNNTARFSPTQLTSINRRLVKLGGDPVPVPAGQV